MYLSKCVPYHALKLQYWNIGFLDIKCEFSFQSFKYIELSPHSFINDEFLFILQDLHQFSVLSETVYRVKNIVITYNLLSFLL